MKRPSTLRLNNSLRESASPIQDICIMRSVGKFATYDASALRLWSLDKQVKSLHHNQSAEDKLKSFKFVALFPIEELRLFIVLYTGRHKATSKGSLARVYSSDLILLQEIDLDVAKIKKVILSKSDADIVIIDEDNIANIIHIEAVQDKEELKADSLLSLPLAAKRHPSDFVQVASVKKPVIEIQIIQKLDCSTLNVTDLILVDSNTLFILHEDTIMIFTKPGLKKPINKNPFIQEKIKYRPGSELNPVASNEPETKEVDSPFWQFIHSSSIILSYEKESLKPPVMIRLIQSNVLLIGFSNGLVQIFQFSLALIAKTNEERKAYEYSNSIISAALCSFKSHDLIEIESDGNEKTELSAIKYVVEANQSSTFGAHGYLCEFFTVGADLRICHWAMRHKLLSSDDEDETSTKSYYDEKSSVYSEEIDFTKAPKYGAKVDFLGDYKLQDAPPSTAAHKLHGSDIIGFSKFMFLELNKNSRRPISKHLMGTYGGMILFWQIVQPHHLLSSWRSAVSGDKDRLISKEEATALDLNNMIIAASPGPLLSPFENTLYSHDFLQGSDIIQTILLLKKDTLQILNGSNGSIMQTSSIKSIKSLSPCVVHWCPYTRLAIVGYRAGGVGIYSLQEPLAAVQDFNFSNDSNAKCFAFHSTDITLIKTFPFRYTSRVVTDPLEKQVYEDITVLLLGDVSGLFSLWQLHPQKKGLTTLLFQNQQHLGKIVSATLCFLPEGTVDVDNSRNVSIRRSRDAVARQSIMVTACDKGLVHAWRVDSTLKLHLIAFFHANHAPQKLTSFLALPKMVYRKVSIVRSGKDYESTTKAPMDLDLSEDISLRGTRVVDMAQLNYEIYCVVGFNNGIIEVWVLSTDERYSSTAALVSRLPLSNAIENLASYSTSNVNSQDPSYNEISSSIIRHFTVVNPPAEGNDANELVVLQKTSYDEFVATFSDGTVLTYAIEINPLFLAEATPYQDQVDRVVIYRLVNFQCPAHALSVVPLNDHPIYGQNCYDVIFVSEFAVFRILPVVAEGSLIPNRWHQELVDYLDGHEKEEILHPQSSGVFSLEVPEGQLDLSAPSPKLITKSQEDNLIVDLLAVTGLNDRPSAPSTAKSDKRKYVGPMDTSQRVLSSELQFAKKDKRLLDLFTQSIESHDSSLSRDAAIEIIHIWIHEFIIKANKESGKSSKRLAIPLNTTIEKENLLKLFDVLEINESHRLKFVEVAKVASITLSAVKKNAIEAQETQSMNDSVSSADTASGYRKIRSKVTKVSYNSMGERVVEVVEMNPDAMGKPEGTVESFKSTIYGNEKEKRAEIQAMKKFALQQSKCSTDRRLIRIPKVFKILIKPQSLPISSDQWSEDHLHFFDIARVVRIARSILDMRSVKQYELAQSREDIFMNQWMSIDSIPALIIKYFERQYGECSRSMNVSRHKVANFLEAILQYDHLPVIRLFRYLSHLNDQYTSTPAFELAIWLVTEARSLALNRGCIVMGTAIDKYDDMARSKDSPQAVKYQYISRVDAEYICNELIRARGEFGAQLFFPLFQAIDELPSRSRALLLGDEGGLDRAIIADENCELLDLESFLEVFFVEFLNQYIPISHMETKMFQEYALNVASSAVPREINRADSKLRKILIDDTGVEAPFHLSNMSKILNIMRQFVALDPLRVGQISETNFDFIVMNYFAEVPQPVDPSKPSTEMAAFYRFLRHAKSKIRLYNDDQLFAYIDFIAVLIAWEEHNQGVRDMKVSNLLATLPEIERGIEAAFADDLLNYVSRMSAIVNTDNPRWVMGGKTASAIAIPAISRSAPKLSIATDGNWAMDAKVPDEQPGLLQLGIIPTLPKRGITEVPSTKVDQMKELQNTVPAKPLNSLRERRSLFGEVANLHVNRESARLTLNPVSDTVGITERDRLQSGTALNLRPSYSRMVEKIEEIVIPLPLPDSADDGDDYSNNNNDAETRSAASIVAMFPSTPLMIFDDVATPNAGSQQDGTFFMTVEETFGRVPSSEDNNLHEDSVDSEYKQYNINFADNSIIPPPKKVEQTTMSTLDGLIPFLEYKDGDFETAHNPSQSMNLSSSELNQSLASEEIRRRINQLKILEEEFQAMHKQEQDEFKKREIEKKLLRQRLKRESLIKERESLKYYREALNHRQEVRDAGRAQFEAAVKAEFEDSLKHDLEIQKILQENRGLINKRMEEKKAAELEKLERQREQTERNLMKKADQETLAIEMVDRERIKQELAAQRAREEEELAAKMKEIAERMAREAEEAAKAAAEAALVEEATGAVELAEVDAIIEELISLIIDEFIGDLPAEEEKQELELVPEIPILEEPVVEPPLPEEVQEEEEQLTFTEKRIRLLLQNMKDALLNHPSHPRKAKGQFFMPQLFGEDITFDPFQSSVTELANFERQLAGSSSMDGEMSPDDAFPTNTTFSEAVVDDEYLDPFADITAAVKVYREERDVLRKQLFAQKLVEVPMKEWTPMYRLTASDWKKFFRKEKEKEELIRQMELARSKVLEFHASQLKEEKPVESMFDLLAVPPKPLNAAQLTPLDTTSLGNVPKSLLQVIPDDIKRDIRPLPFGKVQKSQILFPGNIKFYQIEVLNADTVLTVQIRCIRGLANLYLSYEKLPSPVKFTHSLSCTKENNRLARLSIIPEKPGKYFVSVTSPDVGAEYDIWAYSTGDGAQESKEIEHVSQLINKWNVLSQFEHDNLQMNYPKLEQEALTASLDRQKKLQQIKKSKHQIIEEMRLLSQSGELDRILEGEIIISQAKKLLSSNEDLAESLEEVENVEKYVVKVGRFAMRKEILKQMSGDLSSDSHRPRDSSPSRQERKYRTAESPSGSFKSSEQDDDSSVLFEKEDVNQHEELFCSPDIHRSQALALISHANQQSDHDELKHVLDEEKQNITERNLAESTQALPLLGLHYSGDADLKYRPDSKSSKKKGKKRQSNESETQQQLFSGSLSSSSVLIKLPVITEGSSTVRKSTSMQELAAGETAMDEPKRTKHSASTSLLPSYLRYTPKPVEYKLTRLK